MSVQRLVVDEFVDKVFSEVSSILNLCNNGNDTLHISVLEGCSIPKEIVDCICSMHLTDLNKSVVVLDMSTGISVTYRKEKLDATV